MNATPMTEAEYADRLVAATRRSAWILLAVATGASLAGNVYHAARVTSGSAAAMLAAGVVPVILLLGMHLTGGMAAVRREGRVHPAAHRVAVTGIATLVLMVLAASFFALRDLLLLEQFHPAAAVLIPLAVDVAVVVSTASLFTLTPRLRRTRTRVSAPAPASPQISSPAPAAVRPAPAPAPTLTPAPAPAPAAAVQPAPAPAPVVVTDSHRTRAAALIDGGVTKPANVVAEVLARLDAGHSPNRISTATGIHHVTVKAWRDAAAEAQSIPA